LTAPLRKHAGIGVFGGTFDPVHFGHLRAAQEARELLDLADFRLLPAGTPPHREPPAASAEHRLEMLRLAVESVPDFRVDDREVRRSGRSFMVDTLGELRSIAGRAPLVLVIGQDAANHLDGWHQWRRIFERAHLAIMRRPGANLQWRGELMHEMESRLVPDPASLWKRPAGAVVLLEITQLAISSTDIRQQLGSGRSPRFLLPDAVLEYIRHNRLYFAGQARKG
jgi:nicotinate-nucleotide adenylyltransferase